MYEIKQIEKNIFSNPKIINNISQQHIKIFETKQGILYSNNLIVTDKFYEASELISEIKNVEKDNIKLNILKAYLMKNKIVENVLLLKYHESEYDIPSFILIKLYKKDANKYFISESECYEEITLNEIQKEALEEIKENDALFCSVFNDEEICFKYNKELDIFYILDHFKSFHYYSRGIYKLLNDKLMYINLKFPIDNFRQDKLYCKLFNKLGKKNIYEFVYIPYGFNNFDICETETGKEYVCEKHRTWI